MEALPRTSLLFSRGHSSMGALHSAEHLLGPCFRWTPLPWIPFPLTARGPHYRGHPLPTVLFPPRAVLHADHLSLQAHLLCGPWTTCSPAALQLPIDASTFPRMYLPRGHISSHPPGTVSTARRPPTTRSCRLLYFHVASSKMCPTSKIGAPSSDASAPYLMPTSLWIKHSPNMYISFI